VRGSITHLKSRLSLNLTDFNIKCGTSIGLSAGSSLESQQWVVENGAILLAANPCFCLDVAGGSYSDWNAVHLWERHGGDNQFWTFEADGTIKCKNHPEFCLVVGGPDFEKNKLCIVTHTGSDEQKWILPEPKSVGNDLLNYTVISSAEVSVSYRRIIFRSRTCFPKCRARRRSFNRAMPQARELKRYVSQLN